MANISKFWHVCTFSLAQLAAAVPEIRVFEASVRCRASWACLLLRFKRRNAGLQVMYLERFCIGIEDLHQLAGLLGGEAAIVNRSGDRGHRCDDIARFVDCRQREVERSTGASRQ